MNTAPAIRAVIFDFGGTLADIVPTHDWLFLRACQELGVDLDPSRIGDADSVGWEPYLTELGPAHPQHSGSAEAFADFKTRLLIERLTAAGVEADEALLHAAAARIYELDTEPEMYRPYDDTLPALDALRDQGVRMAILSNHEWHLPALIEGLDLARYMESIVTSAQVGYRKPHPRMFEAVLAELGLPPEACLMVGDSVSADIRGAAGMGLAGVFIHRHEHKPPPTGVTVIRSLNELPAFLYNGARHTTG